MHESIIYMVKEFKDISSRISALILNRIMKYLHIALIKVHAPTEDNDNEEKEKCYETRKEIFDTI